MTALHRLPNITRCFRFVTHCVVCVPHLCFEKIVNQVDFDRFWRILSCCAWRFLHQALTERRTFRCFRMFMSWYLLDLDFCTCFCIRLFVFFSRRSRICPSQCPLHLFCSFFLYLSLSRSFFFQNAEKNRKTKKNREEKERTEKRKEKEKNRPEPNWPRNRTELSKTYQKSIKLTTVSNCSPRSPQLSPQTVTNCCQNGGDQSQTSDLSGNGWLYWSSAKVMRGGWSGWCLAIGDWHSSIAPPIATSNSRTAVVPQSSTPSSIAAVMHVHSLSNRQQSQFPPIIRHQQSSIAIINRSDQLQ